MKFEKGRFKSYEKRILSEQTCGFFAPMTFIDAETDDIVQYDCEGCSAIAKMKNISIGDALDILEKVFLDVGRSAEYLIMPERITLNENTVFYSTEQKCVKIAYVPLGVQYASLKENLTQLICQIGLKVPENMRGYLKSLAEYLNIENYSLSALADKTLEMKRELAECGLS